MVNASLCIVRSSYTSQPFQPLDTQVVTHGYAERTLLYTLCHHCEEFRIQFGKEKDGRMFPLVLQSKALTKQLF
jgi:hypothetical protein